MCIAIYKPAGKDISEETLKVCFENNSDGCGFAYINTDNMGIKRIKVKKTMEFDTFLRQYKRAIRVAPDSPFLIHFRIRTHGETTTFNCHPFVINEDVVFIHNGIIPGMRHDVRKSDTQVFNEDYLQLMPEGFMFNTAITNMIEDFIGMSKLVLLDINGDHVIYNEHKGNWDNGIWYSNTSWKPRAVYSHSRSTSTYNSGSNFRTGGKVRQISHSTRRKLDEGSYSACDKCNKFSTKVKDMTFVYVDNTVKKLCKDCSAQLSSLNIEGAKERLVSCQCFLDWWEEQDDTDAPLVFFHTWTNPWGPFDAVSDQPSEEDIQEYYDSLENDHYYQGILANA